MSDPVTDFCLEVSLHGQPYKSAPLMEIIYNTFPALLIAAVTVWATIKAGRWASNRERKNKKRETRLRASEEYNFLAHEYKRDISRIIWGDVGSREMNGSDVFSYSTESGLDFLRERSYIESILWVAGQENISKRIDRNIACFHELRKISIHVKKDEIGGSLTITEEDVSFAAKVLIQEEVGIVREISNIFTNL